MDILHNILFFIIAIGLLVTFHEFGHYLIARKTGVKVLRFSVGFGRPIYRWKRNIDGDEIEYVIAAIPLGGYVKMLDEREGDVSKADLARAFNNKPLAVRAAIVVAGPLFNFLLAIFLYWLVFVYGFTAEKPLLGVPEQDSIAQQSGFAYRDEIIQIGDTEITSWNQFRIAIIDEGLEGGEVRVIVKDVDGIERNRILDIGDHKLLEKEGDVTQKLGFRQWFPDDAIPPVIGGVVEGGAASSAGLMKGDHIKAVNDRPVDSWQDLVEIIRKNSNNQMEFVIERGSDTIIVNVTPGTRKLNGDEIGYIGAYQHIPDEIKEALRKELLVDIQFGVFEAIPQAIGKTWDMSVLTLRVLWKMVAGEAALSNISGPITIAKYAGVTASIGLSTYLGFLAIISVSLGVLNLLPVPMLDGGHLLYYLIEMIKGSPVSEAFEIIGQKIGIIVLALLMCIALFNDFQRLMQ